VGEHLSMGNSKLTNQMHKVGDLLMAVEDEKNQIYVLGQICKIVKDKNGKHYKVMWLDGWTDEEDNRIDVEQIEGWKGVYANYLEKRTSSG